MNVTVSFQILIEIKKFEYYVHVTIFSKSLDGPQKNCSTKKRFKDFRSEGKQRGYAL